MKFNPLHRSSLIALGAVLLGAAGIQSANAQEYRYRYIEGTVGPGYAYTDNYNESYDDADATRTNRFSATGGLAGGDSGVRNLRSQSRVRAFFNDLDRNGSGSR